MPSSLSFINGGPLEDEAEAPLDPGADLVEGLLARLQSQPAPEPPRPIGPGRQIAGGIGDALLAAARARTGSVSNQPGPFAASVQRNQEEYRLARAHYDTQQAKINDQILEIKARLGMDAQKRTYDEQSKIASELRNDELIRSRQVESDKRTAQRQQEDDERDAIIREREWIRASLLKIGLAGGDVSGLDPSKMTVADVINRQLKAQEQLTGQPTDMAERLKAQESAAKLIDPNMKRTRVSFSGKDGTPNSSFGLDPILNMTGVDARFAAGARVPMFNEDGSTRTPQEINADIVAAKIADKAQKDQERDARLAKLANPSKRPQATVGMKLVEHTTMLQNAQIALSVMSGLEGAPGGPLAGRMWPGLRFAIVDQIHGKVAGDKNREMTERIQNISNVVAKIRSGTAVTLHEEIRLLPELPSMNDTKRTMLSKLRRTIEFEERFIENIQKQFGLTPEDIQYIGAPFADANFIPVEHEAGDIVIFGGEE